MKDCRSEWFKRFVWFWVHRAIRKNFFNVLVWNSESLTQTVRESPVIVFSNHSSWWDAFVDHMCERVFDLNHYSFVDQKTLITQGWLRKIGALDIDLESKRGAVAGLRHALEFLKGSDERGRQPVLFIFPQGKIVPAWQRPLGFKEGLAWLKKNVPHVRLIPLARRFEFLKEDRPQVFLQFGDVIQDIPQNLSDDEVTLYLEERLSKTMDVLQQNMQNGDFKNTKILVQGGWSLNKKWEWVKSYFTGKTKEFDPLN